MATLNFNIQTSILRSNQPAHLNFGPRQLDKSGPRQNQRETGGHEISQGRSPREISRAVPDPSRGLPDLAGLKFRALLRSKTTRTLSWDFAMGTPTAGLRVGLAAATEA